MGPATQGAVGSAAMGSLVMMTLFPGRFQAALARSLHRRLQMGMARMRRMRRRPLQASPRSRRRLQRTPARTP